jgi:hypothetical protein
VKWEKRNRQKLLSQVTFFLLQPFCHGKKGIRLHLVSQFAQPIRGMGGMKLIFRALTSKHLRLC